MPCVCLRTVGSQPEVKYQILCLSLLGVAEDMFESDLSPLTATFGEFRRAFATDATKTRGLKGGGLDYKWDGGSNAGSHFLFRQLLDVYVGRKSEGCFPRSECDPAIDRGSNFESTGMSNVHQTVGWKLEKLKKSRFRAISGPACTTSTSRSSIEISAR